MTSKKVVDVTYCILLSLILKKSPLGVYRADEEPAPGIKEQTKLSEWPLNMNGKFPNVNEEIKISLNHE